MPGTPDQQGKYRQTAPPSFTFNSIFMSGGHFGYIIHDGETHWAKTMAELHAPGEYKLEDHELITPMQITQISFNPSLVHQTAIYASERGPDGIGYYDGQNHIQQMDFRFPGLPAYMKVPSHLKAEGIPPEGPSPGMFLIGHCFRDEELGRINRMPSNVIHPLHWGGIFMAANGAVKNRKEVWAQEHGLANYYGPIPTDDAHLICQLLARYHDAEKVLSMCDLEGMYAIVYFDSSFGELHICVKGAPFFISEQEGTLYWCTRQFPESVPFEGHRILRPFDKFRMAPEPDEKP